MNWSLTETCQDFGLDSKGRIQLLLRTWKSRCLPGQLVCRAPLQSVSIWPLEPGLQWGWLLVGACHPRNPVMQRAVSTERILDLGIKASDLPPGEGWKESWEKSKWMYKRRISRGHCLAWSRTSFIIKYLVLGQQSFGYQRHWIFVYFYNFM